MRERIYERCAHAVRLMEFACAESDIAGTVSELTIVGGKIVYAAGIFASLDALPPPPAMPEWSPVRRFGGYAAWGDRCRNQLHRKQFDASCSCASDCGVHGRAHGRAWAGTAPVDDLKGFWVPRLLVFRVLKPEAA